MIDAQGLHLKRVCVYLRPNSEAFHIAACPDGPLPLKLLQELIGGYIEAKTMTVGERRLCFVFDENGKAKALEPCIMSPWGVLLGPVFVCQQEGEEMTPLPAEELPELVVFLADMRRLVTDKSLS